MTNTHDGTTDDPGPAFERLYAESLPALLGFCLRRCETREDAADLVAEVFLVAWRRFAQLPEGEGARLWLFAVAHRLLANQERTLRRRRNLGARLIEHFDEGHALDPAELLDRRESGRHVRDALATLPPQDSALVTLVAWEGLSAVEAGRVLGLTAGTSRVRLHRARARLRKALSTPPAPGESETDDGPPLPAGSPAVSLAHPAISLTDAAFFDAAAARAQED